MTDEANFDLSTLTADIVSAYVSNNKVEPTKLAEVIAEVHKALGSVGQTAPAVEPEAPKPTTAEVRKSRNPDYLTSFVDGRRYKSLKRHLSTHGMTPDEYRSKYGLPKDYPMVAESYSAQRSALAKTLGLGRKAAAAPEPAPEPVKAKGRGRPKAAAKVEKETAA